MIKVTRKQFETFEFIKHHIKNKGYPPTRVEIALEFDIEPNAATDRVNQLNAKGLLKIAKGVSRGLVIQEKPVRVAS
tara:strand:- start:2497 stop:2727 length:231 start_codon:yes stop_codon:yes gene_type:complete